MEQHRDMEGEREKATDWASPNSLEAHLVREWGDIGHQRAVGPRIIQYSAI